MKVYHKRIGLNKLCSKDITRLEEVIKDLGYKQLDYKFNHYNSHDVELIITNQKLHRILKVIRRTSYDKKSN